MAEKRRIPELKDEEEARAFFDTHDTVELLEETEPEELVLAPELAEKLRRRRERKEVITIRISAPHLAKIRRVAQRKGIPYQTLIQLWLAEALEKEYRTS
ncbi:MAG: CopG family antitoxin [Bacillota bacterium]